MATNWETSEILKTPMEICWQFDYDIDNEQLKNLYSRAKKAQWDAEDYVDWDQTVDPSRPILDEENMVGLFSLPLIRELPAKRREELRAHMAAYQLSQIVHGEQGALMTAAALTHAVPDYEGKLYAATQTMDEARHVEVFERYIRKITDLYPIGPFLKNLIDVTLQAEDWVKIAIGMNMVVEGLALGTFHNVLRSTSCPMLRQIMRGVLADEARHVAFGGIYVDQALKEMHPDDREDVADFTFKAVSLMRESRKAAVDPGFMKVLENVQIDPQDLFKSAAQMRERGERIQLPKGQVHSFKHLMMPALVRVGAITERSRKLYEEAGIPVWEDRTTLERLETTNFDF